MVQCDDIIYSNTLSRSAVPPKVSSSLLACYSADHCKYSHRSCGRVEPGYVGREAGGVGLA